MLKVAINNKPLNITLEQETHVGEVCTQLARWLQESHQYIHQLEIDGTHYSPGQVDLWQKLALSEIAELNLYTFSPNELKECVHALTDISVMLQGSGGKEAMQNIVVLSELMGRVLVIIPQLPQMIQEKVGTLIKELTPILGELISGFEAQDSILIADVVEYEVIPKMESIISCLLPANAVHPSGLSSPQFP